MHPVDEFAQVRDQLRMLRQREVELRTLFLAGDTGRRSNGFEVIVRQQKRRVFQKDLLPQAVLDDPTYWADAISSVVTVKNLQGSAAPTEEDEIVLIEAYLTPPPRLAATHARPASG